MMVPILLLVVVIIGIIASIRSLLTTTRGKYQYISFENIFLLCLVYLTVLVGFGLMYAIFEISGYPVLIEAGQFLPGSFGDKIESAMYFSAITLLSVGYGDITPIGVGRWIAVVEALIGYTMPAAFVVRTVMNVEKG
ncbi:potassium channel family protein [Bacillus timonensis]|nr:potassium channel family protein [Bacillus timonensis]